MKFLVPAYSGTAPYAPDRRKAVRPAHLDRVKIAREAGNIIAGGAILDENGEMIGSTIYVEFESREALDEWIDQDPYVKGNVWQDITVVPIRLAVTD
ncbi:MAG: hypothetical protein F4Y89_07360 [Gammaproteobacteria bacterium]|nr:hypothetical protein [Gammaproteobacteria bacterium]